MLFVAALTVGFLHTVLGPDHYLPFIVIGRARRWDLSRTLALTVACGFAHVLSSVLLGLIGVAAGAALSDVEGWEATRGDWAGRALLAFGAAYAIWGVVRAIRRGSHAHVHLHEDGTLHRHLHGHEHILEHVHEHEHEDADRGGGEAGAASWRSLTPWVLFLIFVLGPCEPLVPLFFASAVDGDWREVTAVAIGYGAATVAAMTALVAVSWFGLRRLSLGPLERWSHAAAGGVIFLAGSSMVFLGL